MALDRRTFLAGALGGAPYVRAAARRPNIVFILTDDQGAWTLGHAGNTQARTPNLDRMCRDGAYFANSFVTTPVCSPSRASLMTSRYSSEVGIEDYLPFEGPRAAGGLDPKFPTWPKALSEAGYRTGLVGKWHLGSQPQFHPTRHGFEYAAFFQTGATGPMNPRLEVEGKPAQFQGSTPDILTGFGLDFIRRHRQEPFLLCLHFRAPHASNAPGQTSKGRTWLPVPDEDWSPFRDIDPRIPNPEYPRLDIPEVKRMTREYLASVHSVDRNVGRVFAGLDQLGLGRNTIVVFTSDNGMNMGHNGIWHKGNGWWMLTDNRGDRPNMYDQSLRVPAVVRYPERVRPRTVRETIGNMDWFPALLGLAGVPKPENAAIRGRDLTPLLEGRRVSWDNDHYAEYNMETGPKVRMRAWRTPDWKLIRFGDGKRKDELYNVAEDPEESRNRIEDKDAASRRALDELSRKMEGMRLSKE